MVYLFRKLERINYGGINMLKLVLGGLALVGDVKEFVEYLEEL